MQAAFKQESQKFGKEYISTDDVMNKYLMTLMHVYVRRANFITKPRFEVEKLQVLNKWIPKAEQLKRIFTPKSTNAKSFAYKRVLVWRN